MKTTLKYAELKSSFDTLKTSLPDSNKTWIWNFYFNVSCNQLFLALHHILGYTGRSTLSIWSQGTSPSHPALIQGDTQPIVSSHIECMSGSGWCHGIRKSRHCHKSWRGTVVGSCHSTQVTVYTGSRSSGLRAHMVKEAWNWLYSFVLMTFV